MGVRVLRQNSPVKRRNRTATAMPSWHWKYTDVYGTLHIMATGSQTIETTAGEVAAELKRRGIACDERVTVTIETDGELIPGRRASRARVVAAGLSDSDIDALVKRAQQEAEQRPA